MSRDSDNNRLLIGTIGGAVLILMTMITAIFLVSRRPIVVVTNGAGGAAPSGGLAAPYAGPGQATPAGAPGAVPPTLPPVITVTRVSAVPPSDDPLNAEWDKVAAFEIPIAPQQVAQPMLAQGTVPILRVQAIRDDQRYAWRLSWDKPLPADASEVAKFSDAVAIQFPLLDGAPYTMGGPNLPVRILYWKALWQKDVDQGFQGLKQIYPNSHTDLYWFAEGKERHAADGSTDNPLARQYMVAAQSNNPMADYYRQHPIEELTAHGFGSGTHVGDTPSRGRGVWRAGKWYVVIDRPISAEDPLVERFNATPDKQLIAFAVWDGSEGNRGGKKQISNWIPMRIAQ